MTALVLAVVLWMLAWSLLCLAFSGLFGRAWKGWQAAALILSGPIALFVAGGYRLHLQGCGRGACFELPGLLAALGKEASELSPDLHLRVLEGATVMLLVSAALFGLGWALARRRSRCG